MITIKIEKSVPYTDRLVTSEESIDEESLYNLKAHRGDIMLDIVERLEQEANKRAEKEMHELGIVLNDEGLLLT